MFCTFEMLKKLLFQGKKLSNLTVFRKPAKLIGLMFGVWFVANFIANTAAGITGSYMDPILEEKGLSYFFMIFTLIPISAGIVMLMLNKMLLKKMHGIR